MKVLSLMQPWATLLVMGIKKIETRGWTTAYRGALLIHASKSRAGKAFTAAPAIRMHIPDFNALPLGAIIGQATLYDIERRGPDPDTEAAALEENAFGDGRQARYHWRFRDAVCFDEPVPATGRLGLWEW